MLQRLLCDWLRLLVIVACLGHISRCGETDEDDSVSEGSSPGAAVPGNDRSPAGHLQPLGSHRPHEGVVTMIDGFIDPLPFHRQYMEPGKPVIFKGAAKGLPAFHTWGSDDYLE